MSAPRKQRSAPDIMSDMLALTRKMAASNDPDFLIASIDKRGLLIEEYDALRSSGFAASTVTEPDKAEIDGMIREIVSLNVAIEASLKAMRDESKLEVEDSLSNQKVLNYTNNAISASGSYMDYRK